MTNRIVLLALIGSLALMVAGLSSCYYDNAEDLLGSNTCDTTAVSYVNDVLPILQSSCLVCHSTASAASLGAGIALEGYDNISTYVSNGGLVGVIDHLAGWSPMPKSAPQLPACERALIRNWVDQGALNN